MTWFKSQQGTEYMPGSGTSAAANYLDAFDEMIGWFATRGWTVEAETNNIDSSDEYLFRYEKQLTTWDGVSMTHKELVHIHNDRDHVNISHYNPYTLQYDNGTGWPSLAEDTKITSTGSQGAYHTGYFEMWESDIDDDSFLVVCRLDSGLIQTVAFHPPTGSRMDYSVYTNNANYAPLAVWSSLLFDSNLPARVGQGSSQYSFSFDRYQDNFYHTTAVDAVIQMGYARCTYGNVATAWSSNQADVGLAIKRSNGVSTDQWQPHNNDQHNTLKVGSKYYIRLGMLTGKAQLLLDCGTTNPNF